MAHSLIISCLQAEMQLDMLICLYYLVCLFSTKTLLKKKTSFAAVRWWWKFCTHQVHYRCVDIISIRILAFLDFSRYKVNISRRISNYRLSKHHFLTLHSAIANWYWVGLFPGPRPHFSVLWEPVLYLTLKTGKRDSIIAGLFSDAWCKVRESLASYLLYNLLNVSHRAERFANTI